MTVLAPSICLACTMYRPGDPSHCAAFDPSPIPENILLRLFDHRRPYPGDHGKLFALAPGGEELLAAYEEIVDLTADDPPFDDGEMDDIDEDTDES